MSAYAVVSRGFRDSVVTTRRNLLRYVRLPRLLFFSSIQPIMFLLLFNYVFGGALGSSVHVPGGKYIDYLLPGIIVQVVMFGGVQTGIGLADDLGSGIIDRFRSLPMSRLSVVAGRTVADTLRNLVVILIMLGVGTLLGFRFQAGFGGVLGMIGIGVLFGFAISWVFALVGMSTKDAETTQLASFVVIFPLVFASAAFVPISTMPGWLQAFANHQPVTFVTEASRHLALGAYESNVVWHAILWCVGILIVFIPLAVWRYKHLNT